MIQDIPSNSDPLAPIVAAVRLQLRAELLAELRAELRATAAEAPPARLMLSLSDCARRYGFGRGSLKKLIAGGKLPVTERRCRGGRIGQFIHLSDAERTLGGRGGSKP